MNVLVTGGTGFVGRAILRQLRNSGHRAHLLARNPSSPAAREAAAQLGVPLRAGDVLDAGTVKEACAGMDGLVHLVGIISEVGRQTFENVHVIGTEHAIAAAQSAGVKRYVHMSALGARPDAASRYHQTKWAAEERVRRSGLGWTIFRPSVIYGPGDGFVSLYARLVRWSPVVPVIGDGRAQFQPISVKLVAEAFVKALSDEETIGETYDLCGEETLTLDQVVDAILEVTGRRGLKLHLTPGAAAIPAVLMESLMPRLFKKAPPLNRDQILMLREDNVGNGAPALAKFGLRQEEFSKAIAKYLKG